jgi:hypothetical protein
MPKVTVTEVREAIAASSTNPTDNELLANLTRISLDYLAQEFPGKAVELRVPPFRVIQLLIGVNHRRGTPPTVIEMSPQTLQKILCKELTWESGVASGLIHASGEQSDLTKLLESL